MRPILHVIDKLSMEGRHPSSCAMLIADWRDGLRSRGYNIEAVVLRPHDRVAAALQESGLPVDCIPFGSLSPRNIPALTRLLRQRDCRIAHLHGYGAANHGRLAARAGGAAAVVHEHAVLPVRPHQWMVDRLLRRRTDAAVAVSEDVRAFMIRGRSIPGDRIRVIPNGVNIAKYHRLTAREGESFRERLGIARTAPLIGTLTRLHPMKGVRFLLEATPAILARIPEARVAIVGDGPERADLVARARALGVEAAIVFAGFEPEAAAAHAALDIFVLPSLREGFGLAVLEAMAAGKAVTATAAGGPERLIRDGHNGLLAPPGDARALADRIIRLLEHPDLAQRLGARAREDSRAYGRDRTLDALAELYGDLSNSNFGLYAVDSAWERGRPARKMDRFLRECGRDARDPRGAMPK